MRGLNWQTIQVPIIGGLESRVDERAISAPDLTVCRDVQFDERGGLQTRKPYIGQGMAIVGGGTATDPRRIEQHGSELVLFTKDAVYSRDVHATAWVRKGTYLAPKVDERTSFEFAADQIEADRAELAAVEFFVWTETGTNNRIFIGARDKTTGAVILDRTQVTGALSRPRLVALDTRVLLIYVDTTLQLVARALVPATPASALAGVGTVLVPAPAFNLHYDAVAIGLGLDTAVVAARRTPTTSYEVLTVTATLVIATATKARACDGPIAVAVNPNGTEIQIVRGNAASIDGDLLSTSGLVDIFANQAIGTADVQVGLITVNQIAAAFSSIQVGGEDVCHVFWSSIENPGATGFRTRHNTVDTANAIGSQNTVGRFLGVASRAFDHDGQVLCWLVFASESGAFGMGQPLGIRAQLQNTYFLFRGDGHLVAKSAMAVAGGFAASTGRLPHVARVAGTTTSYAWCGCRRRVIPLGGDHSGYAARTPHEITVTLDSNAARRCARAGATLYIAGGLLLQFDSVQLAEVGFAIFPWAFSTVSSAPGAIAPGSYSYKSTISWANSVGEKERCTTATGQQITLAVPSKVLFAITSLFVTLKRASPPALELWRTEVNPIEESPFFLTTSPDSSVLVGDNAYIPNDPDNFFIVPNPVDNFTDAILLTKEPNPENGDELENLAPPPAGIVVANGDRLFLGDVAGEPHRVWYSKLRLDGEIAAWHDVLTFEIPRDGGRITAIGFVNEAPVVHREHAIYVLPGEGLDNLGQGQNYGPPRALSHDIGALNQESVVLLPDGDQLFKTRKGWYVLTRGLSLEYIGSGAAAFDAEEVRAAHVVESQHEVRIVLENRVIVFDYLVKKWTEWTISDAIHATIWRGDYTYLSGTAGVGAKLESATYTGVDYGIDVEMQVHVAELQGAARLGRILVLGEARSPSGVRVRVGRNYEPGFFDDRTSPVALTTSPDGPLQLEHEPSQQQIEAVKVRITATGATQATLDTLAITPQIETQPSGNAWAAVWRAVALGTFGNQTTMTVGYASGLVPLVEVRDHQRFDAVSLKWKPRENNVGIRVVTNGGGPTVGDVEAAILAASELVELVTPDPAPAKEIIDLGVVNASGTFTGGAVGGVPNGEAIKLTGLGLEVGFYPGLFRRLAPEQKQ